MKGNINVSVENIFPLIKKFLYSDHEIFLRELISNATDAVEFMLAGAFAIQIGTANFIDPAISAKVARGIADYCERHGYASVSDLTGQLIVG